MRPAAKRPCKRGAEWAMARASEYQKHAFRLNYEAQAKDITKVIKENPEAIPQLRNACVEMGYLTALGLRATPKVDCPEDENVHTPSRPTGSRSSGSPAPQQIPPESPGPMKHISDEIPVFCVHFISLDEPGSCLPPKYLQHLLSEIEPGTLSLHAQKALCPSKRRSTPIVDLQRIFEFIMDLGNNKKIPDSWRHVSDMIVGLKEIHEDKGFRGKDLILPVDWQITGFYALLNVVGQH
jgi:hypothetical protein